MKKKLQFFLIALLVSGTIGFTLRPAAAAPDDIADSPPAGTKAEEREREREREKKSDPVEEALATPDRESGGKVHQLEGVRVTGQHPGEFVVDRKTINATPSATGTVTDLFRGRSDIQYDSGSRAGTLGGEITPPKISIRGAKHYENNFIINGMGNNNRLNPGGYTHTANGQTPQGDSQSIILDTDLLESVKVHTENIPARYGDFTGGVIDARLRDAAADRWHGMFGFRHTSSELTNIHYTSTDREKRPTVGNNKQPEFYKHYWSGQLEGPFWTNGPRILLAYKNINSVIPQKVNAGNLDVTELRQNQNFMLKLTTPPDSPLYASLTGIYAPYKATLYNSTLRDGGEYSVEGGGLSLLLNTHYDTPVGRWSNDFSYNDYHLERLNDKKTMYQWRVTASTQSWANNATTANEGGLGDYKMSQKTYAWLSSFDFKAFGPLWFSNQFETGIDMKRIFFASEDSGYTAFVSPAVSAAAVGSREDGVITGEQWTRIKNIKPAGERSENAFTFAAWLQDTIKLERLTLRPGVRLSYDSLTKNTDIAPRLFANVDILNDQRFNIFGGYSRYYGTQLMERALRATKNSFDVYRRTNWANPWNKTGSASDNTYSLGNLKTPYTDEYSLGASANLWDTLFKVTFVTREYRDQIMGRMYREPGSTVNRFRYSNAGETDYWGLTYLLERDFDLGTWGKHNCALSATYSETTGTYLDWTDNSFDDSDGNPLTATSRDPDYILLNGALTAKSAMKANNFNAPWVITYMHQASFWEDRIRLMGQLRWEQGGERMFSVTNTTVRGPSGRLLNAYETAHQPDTLNIDAKLSVDALKYKDHTLTLELEALNLLDRRNLSNIGNTRTSQGTYAMGRQFYLGFKYTF